MYCMVRASAQSLLTSTDDMIQARRNRSGRSGQDPTKNRAEQGFSWPNVTERVYKHLAPRNNRIIDRSRAKIVSIELLVESRATVTVRALFQPRNTYSSKLLLVSRNSRIIFVDTQALRKRGGIPSVTFGRTRACVSFRRARTCALARPVMLPPCL